MAAEDLAYAQELLLDAGALDVFTTPIGMKKFFPTAIHSTAADFETILFSAGKIGYQVEIPLSSLQKAIRISVCDLIV